MFCILTCCNEHDVLKIFRELDIISTQSNLIYYKLQAEKRAHHNALERKRRDHIKDSFTSLRDSVPALQGEKVVSTENLKQYKLNS